MKTQEVADWVEAMLKRKAKGWKVTRYGDVFQIERSPGKGVLIHIGVGSYFTVEKGGKA